MIRWPIIRHVRWFYLRWRLLKWWDEIGHIMGAVINEADWKYLDDVWEGKV